MEILINDIYAAILKGDNAQTPELIQAALASGLDASKILNDGMVPAMAEVGHLFEEGEYFVPEMLISARAMQSGMSILRPSLIEQDVKPAGIVIIGTVKGDLHDIGKNLVSMMLEGGGFQIVDLGTDVPAQRFVSAIEEYAPDVIAMSALLTTTMINMVTAIDAITTAGLRDKVKVIIGGAPVTYEYAIQIGADGYAPDASRAVNLTRSLV